MSNDEKDVILDNRGSTCRMGSPRTVRSESNKTSNDEQQQNAYPLRPLAGDVRGLKNEIFIYDKHGKEHMIMKDGEICFLSKELRFSEYTDEMLDPNDFGVWLCQPEPPGIFAVIDTIKARDEAVGKSERDKSRRLARALNIIETKRYYHKEEHARDICNIINQAITNYDSGKNNETL